MGKKTEYNYFKNFVKAGGYALQSGEKLQKILDNFSGINMEQTVSEMHDIEQSADYVRHEMMQQLLKEFIPPIEREDIVDLSEKIDTVTDTIEDVLIHLDIFNVTNIRPETSKFTSLVVDCCNCMNDTLTEFRHFKRSSILQSKIVEMNRLEGEGDILYTDAVRNLFKTSTDPVELFVWKDIFAHFEKCFDCCEDVASAIESIVMKNS